MVRKTALEERQEQLKQRFERLRLEARMNQAEMRAILERMELRLPKKKRRRRSSSSTVLNDGKEDGDDDSSTDTQKKPEPPDRHVLTAKLSFLTDVEDDQGATEMILEEVKWDEESSQEELMSDGDTGETKVGASHHLYDDVKSYTVTLYDTYTDEEETESKNDWELKGVDLGSCHEETSVEERTTEGSPATKNSLVAPVLSLASKACEKEEWERKVGPESTPEEEKQSGGDRNTVKTAREEEKEVVEVEEELMARDLGSSCLSLAALLKDRELDNEFRADWFFGELDFWTETVGQAQYLLTTPPQLTNTSRGLLKEVDCAFNPMGQVHNFIITHPIFANNRRVLQVEKEVDLNFNPMGQTHNFIITPPIFTNIGRTLQVVDELNNQRDQIFNISPLFPNILHEEREGESGRICYNGFELLFKGVILIKLVVGVGGSYCSGSMQLKKNTIMMELLFVLQWDPGGLTRDGWDPSGTKREEIIQEIPNTFVLESHENQFHQYLLAQVERNGQLLNYEQDVNGDNSSSVEKQAIPNQTLRGFDKIDMIKEDQACPGVVSCADIRALAAKMEYTASLVKDAGDALKEVIWRRLTARNWILVTTNFLLVHSCTKEQLIWFHMLRKFML